MKTAEMHAKEGQKEQAAHQRNGDPQPGLTRGLDLQRQQGQAGSDDDGGQHQGLPAAQQKEQRDQPHSRSNHRMAQGGG